MIVLEITMLTEGERVYKNFLKTWFFEVQKILRNEKSSLKNTQLLDASEMTAVFVTPEKMKELNKQFRSKNKATDILSFAGDGRVSFGELIFCYNVIKVKAKKAGLPVKAYTAMLLTHGVLHLLGYEHEDSVENERIMFALQDKIMRKVAQKLAPQYKTAFDVL